LALFFLRALLGLGEAPVKAPVKSNDAVLALPSAGCLAAFWLQLTPTPTQGT